MKLGEIIQHCGVLSIQGDPDIEITSLTNDSRQVRPGALFIAVNGCGNDGRAYLDQAIEAGAAAVLFEEPEGCARPGKETSSLRCGNARSAAPSGSTEPAPEGGAEIGFSANLSEK